MKKLFISVLVLSCLVPSAWAQKKDIVKTGYNFGPLPAVGFDADKGAQMGAILQIFDYGDGHNYPNYDSKIYMEASFFTKGSQLYQLRYDNKELIPNVRWCTAARVTIDKAYDFYGFNGYQSRYDFEKIADGKAGDSYLFTPFYRMNRNEFQLKSDFIGKITDALSWEVGYFINYFDISAINRESINKGKAESEKFPDLMPTLYELYTKTGALTKEEASGGLSQGLRAGLVYDTRDKEGAPSRGIWAEGHFTAAIPGLSTNPYARYSLTYRQYLPIVKHDVLTFAYRLNYEGTIGKTAPFYALPFMTVMGEKSDLEGMGGYNTTRGIMRTRVVGLDMFTFNAEFRWRFTKFHVANQNVALGLSAFSDGTVVTRGRDISSLYIPLPGGYDTSMGLCNQKKDSLHQTVGAGFRFIMNENFIIALEYGTPLSHFMKNSPIYNQDGTGAFYINIGYLF